MMKKIVTFAKRVTLLLLTTCVLSTTNYAVTIDDYAISACSSEPIFDLIDTNH